MLLLGFELIYMDDFIDELLHEERCCDVILPRIQVSCYGFWVTAGTWHGGRFQPRRLSVRWAPSPLPKRGRSPPRQFSAHSYCGQMAGCIKMPLAMEVGLGPGDIVLNVDPAPPPQKRAQQPTTFWPMSIVAKRSPISATAELLFKISDNILETVKDRDTVTTEDHQDIMCDLSNGMITNDLEWHWRSFQPFETFPTSIPWKI